ncbi:hypothetical protein HTSR_0442 [Halodesulfurarchaeum formicicum]|uniref:Uncharacterized protein n=1 Tax=Halodesulfurarchaeum formicicum TaxID=1873524 RepID=A0A1D8S2P9_9EURY|nr:hypothetical protein [Halodesulfurarchaeum formicicum]AOW79642.1 hypothetical protein HTSR_0442 [Halodesulfurarchaeum formicicum]APE94893.1 hypothetical protein HSR6_0427 [Halodesulfurarchaeum formicicum]
MTAEQDLEALHERVETLESDTAQKIEDVRDRIVQVKRETDRKAAAEHDHEELAARLTALESDLEAVRSAVEQTESKLDGGFENFEEILETLFDRTADLEADVQTLGQAVRSMKRTLETVAEREQRRARADHLKQTAAARGVRTAKCQDCNTKVDIALLSDGTCPSCGANFHTLDANPGFFGTSVLETGDRPALEGGTEAAAPDLDTLTADAEDSEEPRSALDWTEDGEDR